MKTILLLNLYKFTNADMCDLRAKNPSDRFLSTILPTYCLRQDNGKITHSDGYLQWVGFADDFEGEEYWLFDIIGGDDILMEEIHQGGLEELLEDYDLRVLFEQASSFIIPYEDFRLSINPALKIVIELDYQKSYCYEFGIYEYEMYPSICGYYNADMELVDVYKGVEKEEYEESVNTIYEKSVFANKVDYVGRLFTQFKKLSVDQKIHISERFDRLDAIGEVKQLYKTIQKELNDAKQV